MQGHVVFGRSARPRGAMEVSAGCSPAQHRGQQVMSLKPSILDPRLLNS